MTTNRGSNQVTAHLFFFLFFLFFFFFSFRLFVHQESSHSTSGSNQVTTNRDRIKAQRSYRKSGHSTSFFFLFVFYIKIDQRLPGSEGVRRRMEPPLCQPPGGEEGTSAVGQASSLNSRLLSQVLTALWSHSTRFELASRIFPVQWMAKVPASTQQAGTSPRRNPASLHFPLPLIVLTAPWSHSTRFELVSRISPVRWMAKVPARTQQAGPSPGRNPASSHYPLPCPWATP